MPIVQTRPADDFVDSIGVNVHLVNATYDPLWTARVRPVVRDFGFRHVREGIVVTNTVIPTRLQDLHATQRVRTSLLANAVQNTPDQAWTYAQSVGFHRLAYIEGSNEPNSNNQMGVIKQHQQNLFARFRNTAATAGIPVLGPSFTDRTAASTIGDLSPWLDFGNIHHYYGGRNPETLGWGSVLNGVRNGSLDYTLINVGRPVSGTKPIVITECGWHNAVNTTSTHRPASETAAGKYMPRMFLFHFFQRNIPRSYLYELLDEPSHNLDLERAFGLIRADGSYKPAATALRNMMVALADPGPAFAPEPLDLTLSGATADVLSAAMQKRSGTYYVALWVAKQEWNPDTLAETPAAAQAVTLTVPGLSAAAVCTPAAGANFTGLAIAGNAVSLAVDGNVRIVRLVPAGPGRVRRADDLVNSIGVNVRLASGAYSAAYESAVKPRLRESGIRHVREPVQAGNATLATRLRDLNAATGATVQLAADAGLHTAAQALDFARTAVGAALVSGIEGNYVTAANNLAAGTAAFQQALWSGAKATSPALGVVGPRVPDAATAAAVGNLSDALDLGNASIAYSGRPPETGGFGPLLNGHADGGLDHQLANVVAPVALDRRAAACEAGWHDAVDTTSTHRGAPEAIQARYVPRMFLYHLFRRDIARSYLFDLLDQGTDAANPAHRLGLLRPDGTPKPAFAAVRNLIAALADPGPAFEPRPLAVALSGDTRDVLSALMQKRDGTYYVALWLAKQEWDPDARTTGLAPAQSVTLSVPGMVAASLNDPAAGTAFTALPVAAETVAVPVTGAPVLVGLSAPDPTRGGNLIAPTGWTTGGPGTAAGGDTVTLAGTGGQPTYARHPVATLPNAAYRVNFEVAGAVPTRQVGTTEGGAQVVAAADAAAGSNRFDFAAPGQVAWLEFRRTASAQAAVSAISVERVAPTSAPARRLDGATQCFVLNAYALGLRAANTSLFLGGWIRRAASGTAAYVLDFGRTDGAAATGGGQRVRVMVESGAAAKVFASTSDATSYRECFTTAAVTVGTWYHVGVSLAANGEVQLWWNGAAAGTRTGTVPAASADAVCRVLQLGARAGATRTLFLAASYSDWIWCSGFVPTAAQVASLAAGTRPHRVAGLAPTYHWPMAAEADTEPSLANAATLSAVGSPRLAVGPDVGAAPNPAARHPVVVV